MSDGRLAPELQDAYREQGYVVVRGLVQAPELARWRARLEDVVEGRVPPADGMLVMRDVMVASGAVRPGSRLEAVAKIQDYENDPVLDEYPRHPGILDCVEPLVGRDVMTIHTMLVNKPPNVDGRHPLHQDLLYFPFRPADRIVASWTALEPVTRENGCLVVVPGTHRGELLPHENPDWEHLNAGYFGVAGIDGERQRRVHLEMEPGDTVFFHPVLLHGSGRNRTQGYRRAISAHFASVDVTWAWHWQKEQVDARRYRIVRGERAGEVWAGARESRNPIDPLDYLRKDADALMRLRHAKQGR
ncbi:MAG: phytanoyl-CoA dioxygenase family protein [Myxococcota bacterium]|nr:phytanoyl-CoA dioxygenase family protein [Myxococcota bacterium]